MNKFYLRVGAFLFILIGILSILGFKVPSKISGWIEPSYSYGKDMIVLGIIFLIGSFFIKIKEKTYSICPKCKETFIYNELENGKCKYCEDVDTIDIEEYYKKKDTPQK